MFSPPQRPRRRAIRIFVVLLGVAVLALARPAWTHFQAAAILLRVQSSQHPAALANLDANPIDEVLTEVPTPSGPIRARLYIPRDNKKVPLHAPGLVLVHGVHHLGIDEPRLIAFARAISSSGIRVLTPELLSLADYHVERSSVDLIGYSARAFSQQLGHKVGVLGLSFAGGLSLLAAADPRFAPSIRFVVSVGAHDDLERVSQFLVSNTIERPDGTALHMAAHEYGVLILVYSHLDEFFPPADLPAARETLRLLLWEKVDESRKQAQLLSPGSRQKMELLYNHQVEPLAAELRQSIARHRAEMTPVSPRGNLSGVHVPVLLLHGPADNVIPPSELFWLERDVPHAALKCALVSPAISHVALGGDPSLTERWKLVHFMAQILELTEDTQPAPTVPEPSIPSHSK